MGVSRRTILKGKDVLPIAVAELTH
jgi:hypothetical protein